MGGRTEVGPRAGARLTLVSPRFFFCAPGSCSGAQHTGHHGTYLALFRRGILTSSSSSSSSDAAFSTYTPTPVPVQMAVSVSPPVDGILSVGHSERVAENPLHKRMRF